LKQKLRKILLDTLANLKISDIPSFDLERPKVKTHGELATNVALLLAKKLGKKPQELGQEIMDRLQDSEKLVESVVLAGGGFLNFVLKKNVWQESLRSIVSQGDLWGFSKEGQGKKVLIEFLSANPTGPLHIGNARGAPLGDMLSNLLEAIGYQVTREYYVNDIGGQIDKLGDSILYWIQNAGKPDAPPPEGYQGEYVKKLAERAKKELPQQIQPPVLGRFGIKVLLEEIQKDCQDMGIRFDSWIHEKEILGSQKTEKVIEELKRKNATRLHEGALWFVPEPTHEELSDRESVLERSDGRPTYFANDIAYHVGKYERHFDRIIDLWGSNHHGHVPRLKAAMKVLGHDSEKLEVILYQYVRVKRATDTVKMSKREGNFVTAREVLHEVGKDAFRFFLLMRAPESHLDFDLELAKSHSQENPVYYVQYAHARLASLERKAHEQGLNLEFEVSPPQLVLLDFPEEIELIRRLHEFPEEVSRAAWDLEAHRIPFYLLELAKVFQSYYTKAKDDVRYRILTGDVDTSRAKMYLCQALKQTLSQGLKLMGVSAPEWMQHQESE